jgi:hypothetical protein
VDRLNLKGLRTLKRRIYQKILSNLFSPELIQAELRRSKTMEKEKLQFSSEVAEIILFKN